MQDDAFEWDDAKAWANWRKHGITFEMARETFQDAFTIEWIDDRQAAEEPRFAMIPTVERRFVLLRIPSGKTGFASSRLGRPNRTSAAGITMKTGKHDWSRFEQMTEEAVHTTALRNPDAQPLTDEDMARMQRVPRAKALRRALGLTQEEFAARYQIPLGTLRDWEQGRAEPDQPARAYLKAIAGDPEGVQRALKRPDR
jgi:putative transcriptional regulator